MPAARLITRQLIQHISRGNRWRMLWLRARLSPVQAAARTCGNDSRCLPCIGRRRRASLTTSPRPATRLYSRGWTCGGSCIGSSRFTSRPHHSGMKCHICLMRGLRSILGTQTPRIVCRQCYALGLPALFQPEPELSAEFSAYVAEFPAPQPHELVVVEDKDTAAGWVPDAESYLLRTQFYIEFDGVWARTTLSLEHSGACLRELFRPLVALGVLRDLPVGRWTSGIPSVYFTVKAAVGRNRNTAAGEIVIAASGASHLGHAFQLDPC